MRSGRSLVLRKVIVEKDVPLRTGVAPKRLQVLLVVAKGIFTRCASNQDVSSKADRGEQGEKRDYEEVRHQKDENGFA